MSSQEMVISPDDVWAEFRSKVVNTQPALAGTGKVIDYGLTYKYQGRWATVWKSSVEDIDIFQIKLNAQGARSAMRCYRFEMVGEGNLFPSTTVTCNELATKNQGWPTSLKIGDVAELYIWKEQRNGKAFTSIAFKRKETK